MTAQVYQGGCQCGAVRYEVTVDLDSTVVCNCSRCRRLGTIMAFTTMDKFELLSDKDATTEYLFNKHVIHHLFCSTCGIQSYSYGTRPDGAEMVAINSRCLDGVDPEQLKPKHYDGKNH
jgi:hypothetical protein